jgi:hypothetical protein
VEKVSSRLQRKERKASKLSGRRKGSRINAAEVIEFRRLFKNIFEETSPEGPTRA